MLLPDPCDLSVTHTPPHTRAHTRTHQVTSSMRCLDAGDVANAILWCLAAPAHMEVNDIVIRPTQQVI